MLKTINPLLTSDLLRYLAEMGHGDLIAVVDRNYPSHAGTQRVVELPGTDTTRAVAAVVSLLPVDTFQDPAVWHMLTGDGGAGPALASVSREIDQAEGRAVPVGGLPRFDFYDRAKSAYCLVQTADARPYACFLIAKGVVTD